MLAFVHVQTNAKYHVCSLSASRLVRSSLEFGMGEYLKEIRKNILEKACISSAEKRKKTKFYFKGVKIVKMFMQFYKVCKLFYALTKSLSKVANLPFTHGDDI